jgi:hypothetical protein
LWRFQKTSIGRDAYKTPCLGPPLDDDLCLYQSRRRPEFLTELFPITIFLHYKADPVELARLVLQTIAPIGLKEISLIDKRKKVQAEHGAKG